VQLRSDGQGPLPQRGGRLRVGSGHLPAARPDATRDGCADGRALARACRAGQVRVQRRLDAEPGVA
jgi:hypothetical protein